MDLAREIQEQEKEARAEEGLPGDQDDEGDDNDDDDDGESWYDEVGSLTEEEKKQFEEEVRPVKMVLMKVRSLEMSRRGASYSHAVQMRRLAFKIVHSTT